MSNNLLTSSIIVKRALAVLTEKMKFIPMVNRQYDDQFGYKGGAKAGDTIQVRVPQRAIVRKGRIRDEMDQVDQTIPVSISNYYGVDTGATSAEMAMQIDDFQTQFIDSKISDLLTNVEADFLNLVAPKVPTSVGPFGAFNTARTAMLAKAYLDSQLAPMDSRNLLVNTWSQVDIVDGLKGIFNNQDKIGKQYNTAAMWNDTLGFDWYSSNLTAQVTRGTGAGYTVNGANQTGSALVVGAGTGTINIGDSFTLAGVFSVHPQTKQPTGFLQQFTVTTAYAGGAGTLAISPAITPTGSQKNVSNSPANGAAVTILGTAGVTYAENLAFSKDAFYFVTADLPNPGKNMGVDSASATYQGVTLRFMQGFDIDNDKFKSRFDIVWGGGILRPELAVRIPATISFT